MRQISEHGDQIDDLPDNPGPEEERPEEPVPGPTQGTERLQNVKAAKFRWAEAVNFWQIANEARYVKDYTKAEIAYEESQKAAVRYFEKFYSSAPYQLPFTFAATTPVTEHVAKLVPALYSFKDNFLRDLWLKIQRRRQAIRIEELHKLDWSAFTTTGSGVPSATAVWKLVIEDETTAQRTVRQEAIDYFALLLAAVFTPLARAEMNRMRRHLDAAIQDYERVNTPYQKDVTAAKIWVTNDFIERPFVLLALGETRLEKAESQFKAAAQGNADDARATYESIRTSFETHGSYVNNVKAAEQTVADRIDALPDQPLDKRAIALQVLGKEVTIPGVKSRTDELPGLSRTKAPAESWLEFESSAAFSEVNPRIYALLMSVQARLLQLTHGYNYLGYKSDYVPPWRFQFLLERARYFSEHAKSAQRDYLNFLKNAEEEEFREQSGAQTVEMEKANVNVETARADQVTLEYAVAERSKELADVVLENSVDRYTRYKAFDQYADEKDWLSRGGMALGIAGGIISGAIRGGGFLGALGGGLSAAGSAMQQEAQLRVAGEQRNFEKKNLFRAIDEADASGAVAAAQLNAAKEGMNVASLQRQAALLRHEFAIQNLRYLHNRTLNAEQWFRLANAIRGVADTYLRYAVELAFLTEQAYEFEADKRINIIRFDYDQSELGAYLGADFVLSDLDTVEQEYIVSQRERQQQVRYVLSMAREFPAALEDLRRDQKTSFVLRLEQLERRFPGLYNARIGMVDVVPVALMDSTRFSLDLTHTGTGQLRIKGKPDVPLGQTSNSVLNQTDLEQPAYDWTRTPKELWPIKVFVTEPETAVFSGLSRQDAAYAFPTVTSTQRNAFEGRSVAGGWRIDMSARENQLVPDSLADVLITFTVSGYHDATLRAAIDKSEVKSLGVTNYLSARQIFPDALYAFNRSGRMNWNITKDLLTETDNPSKIRNIAVLLLPAVENSQDFGRLLNRYKVRVRIADDNSLLILSEIPELNLGFDPANPMKLKANVKLPSPAGLNDFAATVNWSFGDGTPAETGLDREHEYQKPGRYIVTIRVERNRRFSEFQAEVVATRSSVNLRPPLTVSPKLQREMSGEIPADKARIKCTLRGVTANDPVIATWDFGTPDSQKGDTVSFDLPRGEHTLTFTAARQLKARFSCSQRSFFDRLVNYNGLSLTTNRRFDDDGKEVTGHGENPQANDFVSYLYSEEFSSSDFPTDLSPDNEWTVEFPLANNSFLRTVSPTDVEQFGLGEIQDVVLVLEYETTPRVLGPPESPEVNLEALRLPSPIPPTD